MELKQDALTADQQRHLDWICSETESATRKKYTAGQLEHGGDLWRKPQGEFLLEEALDQVTYALTLRRQHRELRRLAQSGSEDQLRTAVLIYCG